MPRGGHLPASLAEHASPAHDVENLGLVTVNLNRAWAEKVRRRVQIDKSCVHVLS
jgi:hypothetical protein